MDRFRIFSKRLLLPLVGLTSVGLLWVALPGQPNPSHPAGPTCCATERGPRAETDLTNDPGPASPTRVASLHLQPAGSKAWLPPMHARTWAVLATAFPASEPGKLQQPVLEDVVPTRPHAPPVPVVRRGESKLGVSVESPRVLENGLRAAPVAAGPPARSRQLESIAQEADRHSRQGYELAGRGAYYAARSEFTAALRLVAQGLDSEQQTTMHARALSAGLTAVREAQDFLPPRDRLESDLSVAEIVARHQTPVLKGAAEGVAAMEALKCYFTFAQEQLAVAGGKEIAGSMALHGLGKLHSALAERNEVRMPAAQSKAMTFYQAALLVDPMNYMASNDLGVLLARSGYYAEARMAMEHSLSVHPQAAGWQNLASVYRRLGDNGRAVRAESLSASAQRGALAAQKQKTAGQVQWVDPQTFAQSFAQSPDARQPLPVRQPAGAPKEAAAVKPVAQRPFGNLLEKR